MPRSLNYELPQAALHFGAYAQQILNQSANNKIAITPTTAVDISISEGGFGTPTVPSSNNFESVSTTASNILASDFLQKLGASLLNSIHLQNFYKSDNLENSFTDNNMDADYGSPHVMIDSSSFEAMDDLQKQLQYDKLMNEVWIGIVLTLILISMVFCICSCFLYHQFRTWKRNYQNTVMQSQANDVEAMKLPTDIEDPVPEYTLVSGLPSYEAALKLLHKTPKSCLLVYPSILGTFKQQQQQHNLSTTTPIGNGTAQQTAQLQHVAEVTTPLLSVTTPTSSTKSILSAATTSVNLPTYSEACDSSSNGLTSVSLVQNNRKSSQHATISAPSATAIATITASTTVTPAAAVNTRNLNVAAQKPTMNYAEAQLVKYDYDKC